MKRERFLEKIQKLKESGKIIIVEGKKDKAALEKLGVSNIVYIKSPIYKLCEDISRNNHDAIILTDLDKEGKKLFSMIKENLEKNGVKIDNSFRDFLFKKTELRQIEGIDSYLANIE